MDKLKHRDKLANMYNHMPFNQDLKPQMLLPESGECQVLAKVDPKFFHGGGIMHGAVIFRLLDDACTFAAWTEVLDKACVTKSLNIFFQKPVNQGELLARAKVKEIPSDRNEILVEGQLWNGEVEVARCEAVISRMSSKVIKPPV